MSRYIKVEGIRNALIELNNNGKRLERETTTNIIKALGSLPTIDIVHCKDCKHYISDGGALMECETHDGLLACENDFCSYGERIEE